MDKFAININIAGRNYRLKVDASEEEYVRAAAIAINKKLEEYSGNYSFKDKQDLLAMSNIMFVSELTKLKQNNQNNAVVALDKLHEIDEILS